MNIVFWALVLLAGVAAWFLLAFVFMPLGRMIACIWRNAMNYIKEEEKKDE